MVPQLYFFLSLRYNCFYVASTLYIVFLIQGAEQAIIIIIKKSTFISEHQSRAENLTFV